MGGNSPLLWVRCMSPGSTLKLDAYCCITAIVLAADLHDGEYVLVHSPGI